MKRPRAAARFGSRDGESLSLTVTCRKHHQQPGHLSKGRRHLSSWVSPDCHLQNGPQTHCPKPVPERAVGPLMSPAAPSHLLPAQCHGGMHTADALPPETLSVLLRGPLLCSRSFSQLPWQSSSPRSATRQLPPLARQQRTPAAIGAPAPPSTARAPKVRVASYLFPDRPQCWPRCLNKVNEHTLSEPPPFKAVSVNAAPLPQCVFSAQVSSSLSKSFPSSPHPLPGEFELAFTF